MADTWILLRGLGRESAHWMNFPEVLQQQCPDDRIVCLDWPGNGSLYRERSPLSITDGLEDYRLSCAESGIRPPYRLVGLSMGGMVALQWLQQYPEEVAQANIINSSVGGINLPYQRMQPSALLTLLSTLVFKAGREQRVFDLTANLQATARTDVVEQWQQIARHHPVSNMNLLRQIITAAGFRLSQPRHRERIRLIASKGDRLVQPRCSQRMSEAWQVPLREHPTAGHDLPLDDPEWLADQLVAIWPA